MSFKRPSGYKSISKTLFPETYKKYDKKKTIPIIALHMARKHRSKGGK